MVDGLTDTMFRTHVEALLWLAEVESMDMRIPKHLLRTVAGSPDYDHAAKCLASAGYWHDDGDAWLVDHHGDVHRASLAYQLKHRKDEKERQREKRAGKPKKVGRNVGRNVGETLSDNAKRVRP